MNSRVLLLAAIVTVAVTGLAHGWRTDRWSTNPAIADAVERLTEIPPQVGRWTSIDQKLSDVELNVGEIRGYVKREYRHLDTGATVHLLLVTGESGPVAVHPPTACFTARGYHATSSPSIWAPLPSDFDDRFLQADFRNTAVDDSTFVRVYWAWRSDSNWQVPDNPRLFFAGSPHLHKLYLSEQWVRTGFSDSGPGAAKLLMQELLPHINTALAGSHP